MGKPLAIKTIFKFILDSIVLPGLVLKLLKCVWCGMKEKDDAVQRGSTSQVVVGTMAKPSRTLKRTNQVRS